MKFGILTHSPRNYSSRRLLEAAKSRGHQVRALDTMKFSLSLDAAMPELCYRGKPLADYDGIIPRIGASITFFGTAVVRQFEQMRVFCVNSALGISNSRDKLRSLQILSRYDIGIPATEFVRSKEDVLPAIERVGGVPVIIKLLEGTQGVGVILVDSVGVAQAIIETLQSARQNVLIQKFVAESKGRDIRAFVVGDRVVAAMRRTAQGDEFRSNVHRGGLVEAVRLDSAFESTAIRAAQILGLRVAGVDMLEGTDGPQIMEVNSSPGLEGIERASGKDIAGEIIDFMVDNVQYPEMDIRQSLTVSQNYGVAEFQIGEDVEWLGKSIADSGLRDLDIVILSLARDGKVIANPRGSRNLQAGDRLVCFGKMANMKSLLSDKAKTQLKRKLKTRPEAT